MLTRRVTLGALLAGTCGTALFGPAATAQSKYPDQPVKIIVPFPAGGPTDIVARLAARVYQERLGAPFLVDNRAGAGGTIGLQTLAQAKPDGYTIAVSASGALAMLPHLTKMPFDTQKDFQPITLIMTVPQVLTVRKNLGVSTVAELVALAKKQPGKISFGSSGYGTSLHLAAELFKLRAGNLDLLHVPYRGVAPALTDLMSGQIDMLFGDIPVMMPQIQAGTIVPLAVTAASRSPVLPNVPTMAEAGVKDADAETFYALLAPAGLAADRAKLLQTTLVASLAEPDIKRVLTDQGGIVIGSTPEECRTYMAAENKKWGEVVRLAGVQMQ